MYNGVLTFKKFESNNISMTTERDFEYEFFNFPLNIFSELFTYGGPHAMAPKYASEHRKSDSYDMEHFRRRAGSAESGMMCDTDTSSIA